MLKIIQGFKDFVLKGDLITVAVGLVIGLATTALVSALVEDLITPIIAAIFGEPSFAELSFTINGSEFLYGAFLNAVITFVSIAAAIYFFVVVPYKAYQDSRGATAKERACPECASSISLDAKRCPFCTQPVLPEPAV